MPSIAHLRRTATALFVAGGVTVSGMSTASAVDNTWFDGVVSPGESRYESGVSTSFLRNSSSAQSDNLGNDFINLTCHLGGYSATGGDSCNVVAPNLNNWPASFTYNAGYYQQSRVRAWIGGIPSGPMARPTNDTDAAQRGEGEVRWESDKYTVSTQEMADDEVRVTIDDGSALASTTGTREDYTSRGLGLSLETPSDSISVVVFPEDHSEHVSIAGEDGQELTTEVDQGVHVRNAPGPATSATISTNGQMEDTLLY